MATNIQILLSLICVLLVEGHLEFNRPYFDIKGPKPDENRHDHLTSKSLDTNNNHESWLHHIMRPQRSPGLDDGNIMSYNRHQRYRPYDQYNPYFNGGADPYFGIGPLMDNYDAMTSVPYPIPGIHNIFNIPGFNLHHDKPFGKGNQEEKLRPDEKAGEDDKHPKEPSPADNQPTSSDEDPKLNGATNSDMKHKPNEAVPPKTNEIKNDESSKVSGEKHDKDVDLDKKKDFLLVGLGNNGNNVYLLHENNPNTNSVVIPNGNQPGNNIIYVPYNPGQSNNQGFQVVNGQIAPLPTNSQVVPEKNNVNGYNNGVTNPGQSTANQNYVLIYSNGQIIQIPGVVLSSAQNNVPLQNGNLVQGSNVIVANPFSNNVQNPGTNVIYSTLPNQLSNGQIVLQVPNCMNIVPNNVCGSGAVISNPLHGNSNTANIMTNNGLPSNNVGDQPSPNMVIQPAVVQANSVSNGYSQPNMVYNQGEGPNVAVGVPNQGVVLNNQNVPLQPLPALPINSVSNVYNQPIAPNQGDQGTNAVLNNPSHDNAATQPEIKPSLGLPATAVSNNNAIVLDNNNLSSLGARPAIMISGFKETADDKKDKKKNKDKKPKKDKSKGKEKKNEGEDEKSDLKTN